MRIELFGAQLGPKGQATYIPFRMYYTDPDIFRNTLLISLQFDATVIVSALKLISVMTVFI